MIKFNIDECMKQCARYNMFKATAVLMMCIAINMIAFQISGGNGLNSKAEIIASICTLGLGLIAGIHGINAVIAMKKELRSDSKCAAVDMKLSEMDSMLSVTPCSLGAIVEIKYSTENTVLFAWLDDTNIFQDKVKEFVEEIKSKKNRFIKIKYIQLNGFIISIDFGCDEVVEVK